jgi:hypothetical protein
MDDQEQRAANGCGLLLGQPKQSLARRTVGDSSRPEGIAKESAAAGQNYCLHESPVTRSDRFSPLRTSALDLQPTGAAVEPS